MRRIGLTALLMISAGPVLAQPPPPRAVQVQAPQTQGVAVLPADPQDLNRRGRLRRNRGDFQGGGPVAPLPDAASPAPPAPAPGAAPAPATLPAPALAAQGRGPAPRPAGPLVQSADAQVIRSLQGSVSAVFNPGAKTARVKLIETDDHGVEGVRTLKPGDLYRDGWRLGSATASEATLRKGKALLHVDLSRGWFNRPPPIQPAVLVQPAAAPAAAPSAPGRAPIFAGAAVPAPALRRPAAATPPAGRGAGPSGNGLGLSNARVGGSPPAPIAPAAPQTMTLQGPTGPVSVQANPDGSRTVTSIINGQTIVTTIPAPAAAR